MTMSFVFVSMDKLHADKKFNNVCHVFYMSSMNVAKELEAIMEKDKQDLANICTTNRLSNKRTRVKSINQY